MGCRKGGNSRRVMTVMKGDLKLQELGDASIHAAAPFDSIHHAGEVVVQQQDVRGILGDGGAGHHGKAHIGIAQCGGIIGAVPRHGYYLIWV